MEGGLLPKEVFKLREADHPNIFKDCVLKPPGFTGEVRQLPDLLGAHGNASFRLRPASSFSVTFRLPVMASGQAALLPCNLQLSNMRGLHPEAGVVIGWNCSLQCFALARFRF